MPADYHDNPTVSLDNQCDVRKYGWGVWFFHFLVRWPSNLFVKGGGRWAKLLIALEVRIPKSGGQIWAQGAQIKVWGGLVSSGSSRENQIPRRFQLPESSCILWLVAPTSSPSWVALSCAAWSGASVPGLRLRSGRGGESTKSYPLNPGSVTRPWPLGFAEKNSRKVRKW